MIHNLPPIYWINLKHNKQRRKRMEKRLKTYNLLDKSVKIDAVNGNKLFNKKGSDTLTKCKEIATTMSHIKAITKAYEDNQDIVIIMEDDCCWEDLLPKWKRSLADFINSIQKDWMTIQLGSQGPHDKELTNINKERLLEPWKLRHYGAFCYLINRKGMKYVIDKFEKYNRSVADCFVFDNPESFTSTIQWFLYEGKDSNIHPEYLPHHNTHINYVKELYKNDTFSWYEKEELKKFVFIVPSYNNQDEVIDCIESIINQNYPKTHYRIVYGDDCSDDNSVSILKDYIDQQPIEIQNLFTFQFNQTRKKACWMRNYLIQKYTNDDEICILVDGDDKLADNFVLSYLNNIYKNNDIWITYGGYSSCDGKRRDWGDWPDIYKQKVGGLRESGTWYGSHIRTFYSKLYKKIDLEDLFDEEFEWFESATEVAIMIPMLEMAGPDHSHYVKDGRILYLYTINPNQQYLPERVKSQRKNAEFIFREKRPYNRITKL